MPTVPPAGSTLQIGLRPARVTVVCSPVCEYPKTVVAKLGKMPVTEMPVYAWGWASRPKGPFSPVCRWPRFMPVVESKKKNSRGEKRVERESGTVDCRSSGRDIEQKPSPTSRFTTKRGSPSGGTTLAHSPLSAPPPAVPPSAVPGPPSAEPASPGEPPPPDDPASLEPPEPASTAPPLPPASGPPAAPASEVPP